MVLGASSNAGKTLVCASLCCAAHNMRVNAMPFKAQNMCGSTIATCDGLEVSIAQWLQAAGCGVEASVLMNPVVVKPARCGASRLLVSGEVASESFVYPGSRRLRARLRLQVLASALKLSRQCELVIVEGAGAASEVNLSAFDLSNMWLASALRCDVVLVVDVERGGALAAVAGARQLLTETQSSMVIGFVLNRFVGKLSLLMPGVRALEALTS